MIFIFIFYTFLQLTILSKQTCTKEAITFQSIFFSSHHWGVSFTSLKLLLFNEAVESVNTAPEMQGGELPWGLI